MSLVAVSTVPDTRLGERWPRFDHHEIVAATLIPLPCAGRILGHGLTCGFTSDMIWSCSSP